MEDFVEFDCPYCGEPNALTLDRSGGERQDFFVDCEVCCQPITCSARFEPLGGSEDDPAEEDLDAGSWSLDVKTDSEA